VGYRYDWSLVTKNLDGLLQGLLILLFVAILGYVLAMAVGLLLALLRTSRIVPFRLPAVLIVEVFRGIPLFLLLFLVYYGLPTVGSLVLSPFTAAVTALAITGAAYAAEIYRGALLSVDAGQREAADALGLSPRQAFVDVILPQAARIAVPPGLSLFIALLKGATFVSVIGVADMFYVSRDISLQFFAPFELYTFSGLVIIGITLALAGGVTLLERRLSRAVAR
jgi:His/Glu/Gln/Arg/opine family amino acid ABC transporter permease subunit